MTEGEVPARSPSSRSSSRMPWPGLRGTTSRKTQRQDTADGRENGIVRVRQLLQSVTKSVNKTLAKSPAAGMLRAKVVEHRTETPNDLQALLARFADAQKVLLQIPEQRADYIRGMEGAVSAKGNFDTLLRELGETRSTYPIAEATTAVADTLLTLQDLQSRAEQGIIEFLFTMGRQERKYTSAVQEHVTELEVIRSSLDKVVTKHKTAAHTGGPPPPPEKVERWKQKTAARRRLFEEKLAVLRECIPNIEAQADVAYCQALEEMLSAQRQSLGEAALLVSELDQRLKATQSLAATASASLQCKEQARASQSQLAVARACGPRIIEMLSAPDFAVSLAIAELCSSPLAVVEDGQASLCSLLRLLDDLDLCVPLLKVAVSRELPRHHGSTPPAHPALFRTPSLAGALCASALHMSGEWFLNASLGPLVAEVTGGEADFEIDEALLDNANELPANLENLCKALQWFLDTLVEASRDTPALLRQLCAHIYSAAGPQERHMARCVAGSLLMDAFVCAALRDPRCLGRGPHTAHVADLKAHRALEQLARALSRVVEPTGTARCAGVGATSSSVFVAAIMSDLAVDVPPPPAALEAVIDANRARFVGAGGVVDQLAGVTPWPDVDRPSLPVPSALQEEEEVNDLLKVRALIVTHQTAIGGMLLKRGFHTQVQMLASCVDGAPEAQKPTAGRTGAARAGRDSHQGALHQGSRNASLLPGSNQALPPQPNTWTETWRGPEDEVQSGRDWAGNETSQVLDADDLLAQVMDSPLKAAGLGGIVSQAKPKDVSPEQLAEEERVRRAKYTEPEVEDADSMPESLPARPMLLSASLGGSAFDGQVVGHVTTGSGNSRHVQQLEGSDVARGAGLEGDEGDASGDEQGEKGLLKPRRKFTHTRFPLALASGRQGLNTHGRHPDVDVNGPEVSRPHLLVASTAMAGADGTTGEQEDSAENSEAGDTSVGPVKAEQVKLTHAKRLIKAKEGIVPLSVPDPALEEGDVKQAEHGKTSKAPSVEMVESSHVESIDVLAVAAAESVLEASAKAAVLLRAVAAEQDGLAILMRLQRDREQEGAAFISRMQEGTSDSQHPAAQGQSPGPAGAGSMVATARLFGIGAAFKRRDDGFFYVHKVLVGGPAYKAGLEIGSRVVAMDGERLYNTHTLEQLFHKVLGCEGSTLKLAIQPPGSGVRAPEQLVMVARAFIDEPLLHASALQALPAADGAGPPRDTVASEATHSLTGVVTGPHVRQEAASNPMASTMDADGDKVGIGVTFKRDGDGFFMVKRLSENGGAITSGLAVGDRVLGIDGHSMHRKSSHDLSRCVLGPAGTSLTLLIRSPDGTERDIQIQRRATPSAATVAGSAPASASPLFLQRPDVAQSDSASWLGGAGDEEWDGKGEVMPLEGDAQRGLFGIGATLVRDSRGLFFVAETHSTRPHEATSLVQDLRVGDIIVEVDGIQTTGKSAEAVESLLLGPLHSPVKLLLAQATGGDTRSVCLTRCELEHAGEGGGLESSGGSEWQAQEADDARDLLSGLIAQEQAADQQT